MARSVRGGRLESRNARLKLAPRGKPYWNSTAKEGLHLGYRRLADRNGSWIARAYQDGGYAERAFATADDYSDADGDQVLTYFQAAQRTAGEAPATRHSTAYTCADAVRDYLSFIEQQRKSLADARSRLNAYFLPYFGQRPLATLKPPDFEAWVTWAYKHDPRAEAPKRKPRAPQPAAEIERKRRATINKVLTYALAALNRAFEQGHVSSREGWSRLRKFKGADSARIARLSTAEARRLISACPPDFRQLIEVALLSGCRYGELIRFRARDFDARSGTLLVNESKSGKPRRVPLTTEGQQLLKTLTSDKAADDAILVKADGTEWRANDQFQRMRAACAAAKIEPPINFHALRHTTASLLAEAGVPLSFVAEVLGHSDTRMVSKHYQHLAPSVVHKTIRAKLPAFGVGASKRLRGPQP